MQGNNIPKTRHDIFETFILIKEKIIDGTTPPAPRIKASLLLKLYFAFSMLALNPNISVLCPITLLSFL